MSPTQAQILDLLRKIQQERGMAIMLITHNLGVVAEMADDVVVMLPRPVVEQGNVDDIFHDPKHPYYEGPAAVDPEHRSKPRVKAYRRSAVDPIRSNRPTGCPLPSPVRLRSCPAVATRPNPCCSRSATDGRPAASSMGMTNASTGSGKSVLLEVKGLKEIFPHRRGILQKTVGQVKGGGRRDLLLNRGENAVARRRERLRKDHDFALHPEGHYPNRRPGFSSRTTAKSWTWRRFRSTGCRGCAGRCR